MSNENLWTTLLKETSKKAKVFDSKCVYVGDSSQLKFQMMDKMSWNNNEKNLNMKIEINDANLVESYNYFSVEDGTSDSDAGSVVNVWAVNAACLTGGMDIVVDQPYDNTDNVSTISSQRTKSTP